MSPIVSHLHDRDWLPEPLQKALEPEYRVLRVLGRGLVRERKDEQVVAHTRAELRRQL